MSKKKKEIRNEFRDAVFQRDGFRCKVCSDGNSKLDAHHITDRNEMPNGGYVPENGISLCPSCHEKAELYHSTGISHPGCSPDELYELIESSYESAFFAAQKLG
jgi:5-methylcytosine-specific restriction endonuclease McrA